MELSDLHIIDIFKALADPNRLQIFQLLLESDRTNSELMEATGLRQNLLSHHLNIMTACGLVQGHRSIGDARRHYFSPRLETARACRAWWSTYCPLTEMPQKELHPRREVLFLCMRNGVRSYMAEALARHLASHVIVPSSAGIEQGNPNLLVLGQRVLAENGVPPFEFTMKTYDTLAAEHFDVVVTVCDIVHERELPLDLLGRRLIHWSLADPLEVADDEAGQLAATRVLFGELEHRLAHLAQRLLHANRS